MTPWALSPARQPNGQASEALAQAYIDAALGGETQNFFWQHETHTRQPFDVRVTFSPFRHRNKVYVQAFLQDIGLERRFFEQGLIGICYIDNQGRIIEANPFMTEHLGYALDELKGKHVNDFLSEDQAAIAQANRERRKRGEIVAPYHLAVQTRKGAALDVLVAGSRVLHEGQYLTTLFFLDMTAEQRQAHFIKRIFKQSPSAIVVMNENGAVYSVSDSFTTIFGYEPEAVLGQNIDELIVPPGEKEEAESLTCIAAEKGNLNKILERRHANGSIIHVSVSAGRITLPNGSPGLVAHYVDQTAHVRAKQQTHYQKIMSTIRVLAAGVAHNANNRLQAMMAQAERIGSLSTKESIQAMAKTLVEECASAGELNKQLLQFAREQPIRVRPYDLGQLLQEEKTLLRSVLREQIDLRYDIQQGCVAEIDIPRFTDMLLNFASNAKDAGTGTLEIKVQQNRFEAYHGRNFTRPAGEWIQVDVTDTGEGIPETNLDRIFEPFFTTKDLGKGTGLGLSTVYGLIKDLDGYIDCRSTTGVGTTFTFWLPPTSNAVLADRKREQLPMGQGKRILLVEDNKSVREVLNTTLSGLGYDTRAVGNADEALECLAQNTYDALLTDVGLPGIITGDVLANKVQEEYRIPVCLTTGAQVPENTQYYLQKPFDKTALAEMLDSMLTEPQDTGAQCS